MIDNDNKNNRRNKLMDMVQEPPPYIIESVVTSRLFSIYINDNIAESNKYTELLSMLRNASPNDRIKIFINSHGGILTTTLQLLSAIRECPAYIITVLDGVAHSAACLLLFAGDDIIINPNTVCMFHTYSGGFVGKGHEIHSSNASTDSLYRDILHTYGKPFLTDDEIDYIMDGKDLYFDAQEIGTRLTKLAEAKKIADEVRQKEEDSIRKKIDNIISDSIKKKAKKKVVKKKTTKKKTKKKAKKKVVKKR